jgi:CRP-like cAMP-binding protein
MQPYTKTFKTGAHLFHEDDRSRELYIIQSGRVRVFRRVGQRDIDLAVLTQGAVLGEMALIDGKPRSASAIACEDTAVIIIDADSFAKRLSGVPSWYMSMVRTTSEKIRKVNSRLEAIQTGTHSLHVVLALQYYFLRHGAPADGKLEKSLELGFTVAQFIQLLTVNHQCVMSILDMLQRNGTIDVKNNRITLVDEAKLNGFCEYLRRMFRKSFDKMSVVSPRSQKLIVALGPAASAKQAVSEKGMEIAEADMAAAISKCDASGAALEAVNELRDLGIVAVARPGGKAAADKDDSLSGYQFFVDPEAFEKYFLYCSYKDMVTIL